jgi:hypothetical protein
MREGADIRNLQHFLQPGVATETKDAGSSTKCILNRQEEQVSAATLGASRHEPKLPMPERAPIWYRHWGLNE